ncbi:DUF3311 domain-containing protein [Acidianus brierleyi]|uniref:DUF3311 domain-containing protein n=1 Tax=Acidianus brierleyi TaxID=41673 RepID=A0A2U9IDP6_9CREN|nr:DUF3311 domain-containing protein [Acidianus brierleyi]AWR94106.1 DUF3311 domain-containing protein [Acidianus brierleyi]
MNKFYLTLGIVLLIDIIIYSLYPLFNKITPELFGIPFFYWYQTILLVITSLAFLGVSFIKESKGEK